MADRVGVVAAPVRGSALARRVAVALASTTRPIVVTGATGTVGGEFARLLLDADALVGEGAVRPGADCGCHGRGHRVAGPVDAAGHGVRLAVPRPQAARERFGDRVDVRRLVFGEAETYAASFEGARALFLVRPPHVGNVRRDMIPALAAARASSTRATWRPPRRS